MAPVKASSLSAGIIYGVSQPAGFGNTVIAVGNDINRNIRPTSAGLKGLFPNPPKVIFPIPIATRLPIIIIHQGVFDGRLNASSNPVTTAEQSVILIPVLRIYFCITNSKRTHDVTETAVTITTPMP